MTLLQHAKCKFRMQVFDAAPPEVRELAREFGIEAIDQLTDLYHTHGFRKVYNYLHDLRSQQHREAMKCETFTSISTFARSLAPPPASSGSRRRRS